MKFILSFLILFFSLTYAKSQDCFPNGIKFKTQSDIDKFILENPNCTTIKGDVYISGTGISNLNGLNKISNIYGYLNIAYTNLPNMHGLDNLQAINGYLEINNNDKLYDLNGLDRLESIHGYLSIIYNNILVDISGIENIDPSSIKTLDSFFEDYRIFHNKSLSICGIKNLCHILLFPFRSTNIFENAPGCNNKEEISCYHHNIIGNVFYDENENKIKDPSEKGIANAKIVLNNNENTILLTDKYGDFYYFGDSGESFDMALDIQEDKKLTTDFSSYKFAINILNGFYKDQLNFGVISTLKKHQGEISLGSNNVICDQIVQFKLQLTNTGDYKENAIIVLKIDDSVSVQSVSPLPNEISNSNYIWEINKFSPHQNINIELEVLMPINEKRISYFTSFYRKNENEELVLLDTFTYSPQVSCEELVFTKDIFPVGIGNEGLILKDQNIEYIIRFQNESGKTVEDIKISDIISPNLDLSSLKTVNSSHPVKTRFVDGKAVFEFENINLPDKTVNEKNSQGFVNYTIDILENSVDSALVLNVGYLFFNGNFIGITNRTWNRVVEELPNSLKELYLNDVKIKPNPASDFLFISSDTNQHFYNISIFNLFGEEVITTKRSNIDISQLKNGVYFLKVNYKSNARFVKFIVNK